MSEGHAVSCEYDAALTLCRRARSAGDRIEAVRAGYRAVTLGQTAEAYVAVGRALRDVGSWDAAVACYRKSLDLDDSPVSNRFAYCALAAALRGTGVPADLLTARQLAKRACEANPDDPVSKETLAAIERDLRRSRAVPA